MLIVDIDVDIDVDVGSIFQDSVRQFQAREIQSPSWIESPVCPITPFSL